MAAATHSTNDATDDEVIEQAMVLLPEIGKSLYLAFARHPLARHVPIGQIKTLGCLLHAGPISVREVADRLGVSMPAASESLDKLVEQGMVERATDPSDRRRTIVALTPTAQRIGAEMREVRRRQIRAALDRLEPAERPVFLRAIQALVDVLGEEPERWFGATDCRTERR